MPNMFWNSIIQLMIESFIVVVLSGFIQFRKPLNDLLGQKINLYFCYFCMGLAGLFAISTCVWIHVKFNQKIKDKSDVEAKFTSSFVGGANKIETIWYRNRKKMFSIDT